MFDTIACATARYAGSPAATAIAFTIVIGWAATGPWFGYSENWQLVINTGTTIITFLMVFLIQASTNRASEANQAKLDELIRAINSADNRYIGLDRKPEKEIEEVRAGA